MDPSRVAVAGGLIGVGVGLGYWMGSSAAADDEGHPARGAKSGPGTPLPSLVAHDAIYLDWNATTPIFPEVTAAMLPFTAQHFGNPSSNSAFSAGCRAAIDEARRHAAALIDADPDDIIFTASGTESDNMAIHLALKASQKPKKRFGSLNTTPPHVVTTNIEHPAIDRCLAALERDGKVTVTRVKVNAEGRVSADDVIGALTMSTVLVTVMHSNNEVGSLQPITEIAEACKAKGILCHTDAAQSCGKVSVSVKTAPVDMVTVVGHKFGCPKGVAFLYVRKASLAKPGYTTPFLYGESGLLLLGGGQEHGRRAGTENVLLISALGAACKVAKDELAQTAHHMASLREHLLGKLSSARGISVRVNGPLKAEQRLPNTLSVGLKGVHSGHLLVGIKDAVAASAGSACHTGGGVSAILTAMEVPMEFATGTLRLSVGRHTTLADVDQAADIIIKAAQAQGHAGV